MVWRLAYRSHDAKTLADTVLEEILGVYHPPDVRYRTYGAVSRGSVFSNRRIVHGPIDAIYQWCSKSRRSGGRYLALRGYSRGESYVARNVGLKSVWDAGRWQVSIIFMDHDALVIPGPHGQGLRRANRTSRHGAGRELYLGSMAARSNSHQRTRLSADDL